MSKRWRVNDFVQVVVGGKTYSGGEEFTASDNDLDELGSRPYVTEVRQQAAPKAANKAVAAPSPHKDEAAPAKSDSKK